VGGDVEVAVEDRGPGVPPEMRETIFDPFYSGTGGSGLGLAVVRRICDEQGWQVRAADTPGGGATFVVSLPAAGAGQA
jgi:signal transduction histidine kinase